MLMTDSSRHVDMPSPFKNISEAWESNPTYRCPCCKSKTLHGRGAYEGCPVCFWEDDGQDEHDADVVRGGPNGELSLRQAQANYREFGAKHRKYIGKVSKPRSEEL